MFKILAILVSYYYIDELLMKKLLQYTPYYVRE